MSDIDIRIEGHTGRITLRRPKALNAMTYDMCMAIDAALRDWATRPDVAHVLLEAEGERAFCAGGDIAELYATGKAGDFAYGRRFWADEYRLNALLFEYPKPVVSFLQGFTMGGGVGIGCHGAHRIVGESSRIAMPECGIGLMPDVGGTLMLAQAPGRLGEYLGCTGARMNGSDAIFCGFADHYIPELKWPEAKSALLSTPDADTALAPFRDTADPGPLQAQQAEIDRYFGGETLGDILRGLRDEDTEFAQAALKALRGAPLSMACTVEALHRLRGPGLTIRAALDLEYRFTFRAMEQGDFLEGIRAQIIDKDRNPQWQFADLEVPGSAVLDMLAPLGKDALTFEAEEETA